MTRLGVILPVHGPQVADGGITEMARRAEAAGAEGLWIGDHIVMRDLAVGYPFNESNIYPVPVDTPYFESFTLCAMMAAVTTSCTVGAAVLVLPQRNVLQLAKTVTTIDAVSGGRFVLGVGAGWYAGEMEALGYNYSTRGKRLDQMLDVLDQAWTGRITGYEGSEVVIPEGVVMQPQPRAGHVPVIAGGLNPVAMRRAARTNGWMGLGYVARFDRKQISDELEAMKRVRLESGRSLDGF